MNMISVFHLKILSLQSPLITQEKPPHRPLLCHVYVWLLMGNRQMVRVSAGHCLLLCLPVFVSLRCVYGNRPTGVRGHLPGEEKCRDLDTMTTRLLPPVSAAVIAFLPLSPPGMSGFFSFTTSRTFLFELF